LEAVRKNGLGGELAAANAVGTPLSGYLACPSPVCLNPRYEMRLLCVYCFVPVVRLIGFKNFA